MKRKRLAAAALALVLATLVTVTAYAEEIEGAKDWKVSFSDENRMESNFRSADIDEAVAGIQPGDSIEFHVALENNNDSATEWYMTNEILYSLEDRSRNSGTSGGAYEYELTYVAPDGSTRVLFSSDTVGGEIVSAAGEGLHEATDALKDFFYLDTLEKGRKGHIYLRVKLDGETQGNDYQDTLADIQLNFAVTDAAAVTPPSTTAPPPTKPSSWIVKTGDELKLSAATFAMGASGIVLLALAVWGNYDRRKSRKGGRS